MSDSECQFMSRARGVVKEVPDGRPLPGPGYEPDEARHGAFRRNDLTSATMLTPIHTTSMNSV